MKPTTKQKAAAWRWAASEVEAMLRLRQDYGPALSPVLLHVRAVIVPSLRKRARIIARNARVKK